MTVSGQSWRVPRKVPVGKLAIAAIVGGVGTSVVVARGEWWQGAVAGAVVAGLVVWAVRDLVAPVRLVADPEGLTVVTGFADRQRLEWARVERIRVDPRRRSRMLEVDVGDHLYLFSRYDLDADLDEVAAALTSMRARRPGAPG